VGRSCCSAVVAAALALLVAAPVAAGGYREQRVRATAQAAGFADIADRLAEASRPTLVVNRKMLRRAPRELGTSRLGGLPDLARGQRWPQCGGRAQTFLGQVRLRDLPRAAEALRRHGGGVAHVHRGRVRGSEVHRVRPVGGPLHDRAARPDRAAAGSDGPAAGGADDAAAPRPHPVRPPA
jgi:hypothetical protein